MKISVITPCYNSSATLERTYMSLLAQDNVNFEWILVDDFSSDKGQTKALILKFAETAPFPVKYKLLDENFFGSRCAFEGAKIADGEFDLRPFAEIIARDSVPPEMFRALKPFCTKMRVA